MKGVIKYVHAIAPRDTDVDGPFPMSETDLVSAEAARRWARKHVATRLPLKGARKTDDGAGWIFFPMRRGSIWWSVTVKPAASR